jgi:uridine phosphorylase
VKFQPIHINATEEDFHGNKKAGRYIFFPGSNGRAKEIAEHFSDLKVKEHSRGHNLYLGTIKKGGRKIDVASISSGMGTPSLDIICNELLKLGAKRILRVGTSGSLQPDRMKVGDFVVATASVRDEGASRCYAPLEYPAVASLDMVYASKLAAKHLKMESKVHTGIIHSKDSLYAREFGEGPLAKTNKAYMEVLEGAGVLASEMEASMLFTLVNLADNKLRKKGKGSAFRAMAGTICSLVSVGPAWATKEDMKKMTAEMTQFSIQTYIELSKMEDHLIFS